MNHILNGALKFVRDNSHHILSVGAIIGTGATAYLSTRAGWKSSKEFYSWRGAEKFYENEEYKPTKKEIIQLTWKNYIPPAVAFLGTTVCIVGSNRVSSRKIVAATMAYSLSEKAFNTYKEKVVEQLGEKKEKAIVDEIAADNVRRNPPPLIISGSGVLCCEADTGRYFNSTKETIEQAVNKVNAIAFRHCYVSLDDFYDLVGLDHTAHSHDFGWVAGRLMELYWSSSITDDGRPCLTFVYNYLQAI